jgi:hypothetical protein
MCDGENYYPLVNSDVNVLHLTVTLYSDGILIEDREYEL